MIIEEVREKYSIKGANRGGGNEACRSLLIRTGIMIILPQAIPDAAVRKSEVTSVHSDSSPVSVMTTVEYTDEIQSLVCHNRFIFIL